jgi:thioredoxin 1
LKKDLKENKMESFKDIISDDKPVLVDFYATWCGPCKVMSPIIEEIGKEMTEQIRVLKVDVDKNSQVSDEYRINSVPTLIIFKNGRLIWRNSGAMDKNALMMQIKNQID